MTGIQGGVYSLDDHGLQEQNFRSRNGTYGARLIALRDQYSSMDLDVLSPMQSGYEVVATGQGLHAESQIRKL